MNARVQLLGIGGVVVAVALGWVAFTGPLSAEARADSDDPPLIQAMNDLNDGYRELRREARRENFGEASVQNVQRMIEAAVVSMGETPPMAEDVPTDELDEFMTEYNKVSADLVRELLDLKIAILEERTDDIMGHLRALLDLEDRGHEKFDPNW